MKFPKTIKNFVQGGKPPFPRYGSASGDCLRQVSPVVSIRNLSIRRTKLPSKAFICLRMSYSALFSRHSAKALPSRLPASLTSFRLLPSVPTSHSYYIRNLRNSAVWSYPDIVFLLSAVALMQNEDYIAILGNLSLRQHHSLP